jgi:hypothetical protein
MNSSYPAYDLAWRITRMPLPAGIFTLKTADDLLGKLESDFLQLQAHPTDPYVCFNFFVTAEHMPEWYYKADTKCAGQFRQRHALLRICSQLANGAKHFETKDKKHASIAATNHSEVVSITFTPGSPQPPVRSSRPAFVIALEESEFAEMGGITETADELAAKLITFWRAQLKVPPP